MPLPLHSRLQKIPSTGCYALEHYIPKWSKNYGPVCSFYGCPQYLPLGPDRKKSGIRNSLRSLKATKSALLKRKVPIGIGDRPTCLINEVGRKAVPLCQLIIGNQTHIMGFIKIGWKELPPLIRSSLNSPSKRYNDLA